MKLAAIYNVFDGSELLDGSMTCLKFHVDHIIIIWQDVSNFGDYFDPTPDIKTTGYKNLTLHKYHPEIAKGASYNEKAKRNIGLDIARSLGCTHFLHIDVDEYYEDFAWAKDRYIKSRANGSVCGLYTYFKSPTLRFETPDEYYVPFIHELHSHTVAGVPTYPFYVDPTRRINTDNVVHLPFYMDHYSYVRKNISRKVNNSTARYNIEKTTLIADYHSDLKHGSLVKDYHGKKLIEVKNKHNIYL